MVGFPNWWPDKNKTNFGNGNGTGNSIHGYGGHGKDTKTNKGRHGRGGSRSSVFAHAVIDISMAVLASSSENHSRSSSKPLVRNSNWCSNRRTIMGRSNNHGLVLLLVHNNVIGRLLL